MIIHVSDQRLATFRNGEPRPVEIVDDKANKAVVVLGQLVIGVST